MQDFRNIKVWNESHQLTLKVYEITSEFPKSEMFNLTSQLRRACVSIPNNIAEGCGRNSDKDFLLFEQCNEQHLGYQDRGGLLQL